MPWDDADPDLYDVLGVAPTASASEITSAYRRLVRALHPDSRPDAGLAAGARLGEVLAAYHVLHDDGRRASYDERRSRGASPTPGGGGVSIPVRYLDEDARSVDSDRLRAGPVHYREEPSPWPGPAHRPAAVPDLLTVMEVFFRRWW